MNKEWVEERKREELSEVKKDENELLNIINKEGFLNSEKAEMLNYLNKKEFINLPFAYAVYLHNLKNNETIINEKKINTFKAALYRCAYILLTPFYFIRILIKMIIKGQK